MSKSEKKFNFTRFKKRFVVSDFVSQRQEDGFDVVSLAIVFR
jgi:hypothetical protein